jgi:hypothetical protein
VQYILQLRHTASELWNIPWEYLHDGEEYHILHYTGHGGMSSRGSFLALEGDDGEVQPVFVQDLLPIIRR